MVAELFGWFPDKVIYGCLNKTTDYTDVDEINYFYDPNKVSSNARSSTLQVAKNSGAKYSSPSGGACLYMDVGCWAGNGPDNDANHPRHREFGIVFANIAILCRYPDQKRKPFDPNTKSIKVEVRNQKLPNGKLIWKEILVPFSNTFLYPRTSAPSK